jgi:putative phosphoesterase
MKRIGLLSDTHSWWDDRYEKYFEECDEIWHAGDIGSLSVAKRLAEFKPFRAVYGNCDGQEIRELYPLINRFTVDNTEVVMKHIGGYPGNYDSSIRASLFVHPPKLFISGHSHILKVVYDKSLGLLHINPGAAGIQGFQLVRTLVRFTIDNGTFKDLEVIQLNDEEVKEE